MSETANGAILQVENVDTYYGNIRALKGISIEVRQGEIVTLLGANGAGKTTTLRSINGLNRARRGKITFLGRDITGLSAHGIVKLGISQLHLRGCSVFYLVGRRFEGCGKPLIQGEAVVGHSSRVHGVAGAEP